MRKKYPAGWPDTGLLRQERDRALLQELQVDATFEPLTLYHPGTFMPFAVAQSRSWT